MNKRTLLIIATITTLIQACGLNKSDTELVKSGILEFNRTLAVGEAFDRWDDCESRKWQEFQTSNGQRVVQFDCHVKSASEFLAKVATSDSVSDELNKAHLKFKELVASYQWTINKDGTFQLAHVSSKWTWSDGKTLDTPTEINAALQPVYNNEITFDISSLDALNSDESTQVSLDALKTAMEYDRLMYGLYMETK